MGLETATAVVVHWDLVGQDLADMHGMVGHCSWHGNVDLVGRQRENADEVLEQTELEMRVHLGKGQASCDHSASMGGELVRMGLENCDHCLASYEAQDHAFEGFRWDLVHEGLGPDDLVVADRLETRCWDLGEA